MQKVHREAAPCWPCRGSWAPLRWTGHAHACSGACAIPQASFANGSAGQRQAGIQNADPPLRLTCRAPLLTCERIHPAQPLLGRAQAALRMDPNTDVSTVALDLPCTFFMLNAARALALVEPVARTLRWSPVVQKLADKVVDGLTKQLGEGFDRQINRSTRQLTSSTLGGRVRCAGRRSCRSWWTKLSPASNSSSMGARWRQKEYHVTSLSDVCLRS